MNAQPKYIITLLSAISVFTLITLAQQPQEVPGETLARMQKLGEELATPTSSHLFLHQLAGEWVTTTSVMGMAPSTGTASYKMIFGGRYLDGSHDGTYFGIPFNARTTIGYDNYKQKFVYSSIDDLSTTILGAEGILNPSIKVLSLWGTMDEWMTDEHDKPVMYRYIIIDENNYVFEVHDLSMGDKSKVIEVMYTRVTAPE